MSLLDDNNYSVITNYNYTTYCVTLIGTNTDLQTIYTINDIEMTFLTRYSLLKLF